jgi:hypothetical protein
MAELFDLYGENHQNESKMSRLDHVAKVIATNVSNYEFNQKFDMSSLWENNNFKSEVSENISDSIFHNNSNLIALHINKHSNEKNILPYFINEPNVEYFRLIDLQRNKIIIFYVTPYGVGVF